MKSSKLTEKPAKFDLSIKAQRVEVERVCTDDATKKARVVVVTMA